jgi:siroheme synthase-like protein
MFSLTSARYFSASLAILPKAENCLVVGAGDIAARKIELLAKAGAKITVIAPEISNSVSQLVADNPTIEILQRNFSPDDIAQQRLIISATNQTDVNILVAATAESFLSLAVSNEFCNYESLGEL